ncbi:hypothetical protein ACWGQ5_42045 [Streptomyces sp. NPDC055722]
MTLPSWGPSAHLLHPAVRGPLSRGRRAADAFPPLGWGTNPDIVDGRLRYDMLTDIRPG